MCPTNILHNRIYQTIKNVGYTVFFALVPFILLVLLSALIIGKVANDARLVQLPFYSRIGTVLNDQTS